jgi:diguanylate cyclase (GGDEF)-like protein
MEELKGTRALVVDDDRLIREMVADTLLDLHCEVEQVESGSDALARIAKSPPFDVVFTDLSMREMDGLQLLETIKRSSPKLDVIILTGYASLESALQAMRLGAADYLRKPARSVEIVHSVRQTILRRRILNENEALRGSLQTFEASRVLAGCLEATDVLPLAVDILLRLTGAKRSVAQLGGAVAAPARAPTLQGFAPDVEASLRAAIEHGDAFDLSCIESGTTPRTRSAREVAPGEPSLAGGTLLELPLWIGEQVAGAIWLVSSSRSFSSEDYRRCEVVVAQAELALSNAERFHQAREKAFVDDVTELYNARYLLSAIDREVGRAERQTGELSVVFLDLDYFKRVNDSWGHLVGSGVLRELGRELLQCVRSIDTLARYGGDEFTILLVDTTHEQALETAERICRRVEAARFGGECDLRLTVSLGVATFPQHATTCRGLLHASDQAMYLAKASGRNRVASATDLC